MSKGYVLSLCDKTANMVRPWAEAGYHCTCVDIQHEGIVGGRVGKGAILKEHGDVTNMGSSFNGYDMVFAFPPCTHLAVSGARWFKAKGMDALIEALQVVNACRKIAEGSGAPYMIENPVSTLSTYWRKPDYYFDPYEYGGYLEDPREDAYTKKTCLWTGGGFVMPEKRPVPDPDDRIHKAPPSDDRGDIRSVTPMGFARAVYEANQKG